MDIVWIEALVRINAAIVAAEVRFNAQVITLIGEADQGQDTTEAEGLIVAHDHRLALLRAIRDQLLQVPMSEG